MAETNTENQFDTVRRAGYGLEQVVLPVPGKSEADYLRSIDTSLRTIKRIAVWFLVVSILGLLVGLITAAREFSKPQPDSFCESLSPRLRFVCKE